MKAPDDGFGLDLALPFRIVVRGYRNQRTGGARMADDDAGETGRFLERAKRRNTLTAIIGFSHR
ncbi:MAG: hypothetical protein WA957_00270 [Alteraurantiacibacter sp.]